jgi:hypothetical protein
LGLGSINFTKKKNPNRLNWNFKIYSYFYKFINVDIYSSVIVYNVFWLFK